MSSKEPARTERLKRRKGTVELREGLARRLAAYASAAGAGVLALAQPLQATDIVYTPAHTTLLPGYRLDLDLNHDGIDDFSLIDVSTQGFFYPYFKVKGARSGDAVLVSSAGAARLSRGASIGANGSFQASGFMGSGYHGGPWVGYADRINGFLGFQFKIQGETHYGWALLAIDLGTQEGFEEVLLGYAYDTVANESIQAGQTVANQGVRSENTVPEPQPGTPGALALGARGLSIWRRSQTDVGSGG